MPRISIVVPVYNVEDYLALSMESLCSQTLKDIEILCVNDGSTDSSGNLLNLLAKSDSRIIVLNKDNGGVSSARNLGISKASGDIVCTFDPDDLMDENACEVISRTFDETDASVLTFGASPYPEFGGYPWLDKVLDPRDVVYDPFDPCLLFDENSSPYAWRTACERDFLLENQIFFDESLPCGEDLVFQFKAYTRSPRTVLSSAKLMRYRVARKGSAMDKRLSDPLKMAADHVAITSKVFEDWHNIGLLNSNIGNALDWAGEFVMVRLFRLEEDQRIPLLGSLKSVLLNYFSESDLRWYISSGRAGEFVEAVVFNRGKAVGSKKRKMLHRYLAQTNGRRFVFRMMRDRVIWDGPWGKHLAKLADWKNKDKIREIESQWNEWEMNDRALRESATANLYR